MTLVQAYPLADKGYLSPGSQGREDAVSLLVSIHSEDWGKCVCGRSRGLHHSAQVQMCVLLTLSHSGFYFKNMNQVQFLCKLNVNMYDYQNFPTNHILMYKAKIGIGIFTD